MAKFNIFGLFCCVFLNHVTWFQNKQKHVHWRRVGTCQNTATRRVGKNLLVVSGKTVSDFLKIHTFLMFIFKTIFNENYKKLQALKLAFKSFSSKMSKLAIF